MDYIEAFVEIYNVEASVIFGLRPKSGQLVKLCSLREIYG